MSTTVRISLENAAGQISRSLIYPVVMISVLTLHFILRGAGLDLLWATYIPITAGALGVTLLELALPYRKVWLPRLRDVWNDAIFLVLVQMVLPRLLTIAAVLGLAGLLKGVEWQPAALWPHGWPLGLQAVLMILTADFLRYWLHRWAHETHWLWKLHAVHHSPQRLYWLNVGRFHPVDKGLQFLLDSLPFVVLGVSADVLALYFVFYAVNGFFQHCNIDVRMGILNWIISGPQLHRWHHSRLVAESNTNYGNNIIIWDILFGTRFFPAGRVVDELGLINGTYPDGFADQMKTPFHGDIDKRSRPLQDVKGLFLNVLLRLRMRAFRKKLYVPLVNSARHPDEVQKECLLGLVRRNADTEFGRAHGFAYIRTLADFQRLVPVHEYEALRPYIERQERERLPALTATFPVMYNVTSGTTGRPKYIPVLTETLDGLRRSQRISALVQYDLCPEAFEGALLGLVSPAIEGMTEHGIPYGSASGHIYKSMPRQARAKYVLPAEVFEIRDPEVKYAVIARLAAACKGITFLGTANPSSLHKLLAVLNTRLPDIAREVETGTCAQLAALEEPVARVIRARLHPDRSRGRELAELVRQARESGEEIPYAVLWPWMKLIATWTGGSCGIALGSILSKFPNGVRVVDIGYLASELRGTITIDPVTNAGLPTFQENIFEFVSRGAWEEGQREFLTLSQLHEGEEYYVFITTPAGLYRYNMNDVVRVTGHFENTPLLRFVQKGRGVTNVTGEKLYESQLIEALNGVMAQSGRTALFWQALADESESRYEVYLEPAETGVTTLPVGLAAALDDALRKMNLEYDAKRTSDRLKPMQVIPLRKGAAEAYKAHYLARGQREGQFKPVILQYKRDITFRIQEWVVS